MPAIPAKLVFNFHMLGWEKSLSLQPQKCRASPHGFCSALFSPFTLAPLMPFLLLITFLSTTPGWSWCCDTSRMQHQQPAVLCMAWSLSLVTEISGKSGPKGLKRQKSNEKEPNMLILKSLWCFKTWCDFWNLSLYLDFEIYLFIA